MKILGLDYGTVRIGVAVSDALMMGAHTRPYIENNPQALEKIKKLLKEEEIEKIIVGYPKNLQGGKSAKAEEVDIFVNKLKTITDLEIILWDERNSTKAAQNHLIFADVRRAKRKEKIDSLAAVFILQGYLDFLFHSKKI